MKTTVHLEMDHAATRSTIAKSVLLIIPAFNEEKCIGEVVRRARTMLSQADVLVVDDGSIDQTSAVARRAGALVVTLPFNLGIGGAVQTGLKFARTMGYEFVARIDADGQHDSREIALLLATVQGGLADVAVGSRFLTHTVAMRIPLARRFGIGLFSRQVTLLTGQHATDTTSGMSVMNRAAIHLLASHLPQDYPEVEGRIIIHKAGLRIAEIPVNMSERMAGVSSIDSWRSLYYALKVSVGVLLTAMKQTPKLTWSSTEVSSVAHESPHNHRGQPVLAAHHGPAGAKESTA